MARVHLGLCSSLTALMLLQPVRLSAQHIEVPAQPDGVVNGDEVCIFQPMRSLLHQGVDSIRVQEELGIAPCPVVSGWLRRAVADELRRENFATFTKSMGRQGQQTSPRQRSWIGRHSVLLGTLVGFGGGFLIGYAGGDDGVFYDFTAEFNGVLVGGIGAGAGALVGAIVGAATKQP